MIIVKLIGGLGNQMFQYALGRHLAIKNNCPLKLDISGFQEYKLREYNMGCFEIQEHFATADELSFVSRPSDGIIQKTKRNLHQLLTRGTLITYILEKDFCFQPDILKLGDNIYLDGYWQSEKYFSDIEQIIRKEFRITSATDKKNELIRGQIERSNSVAVHIRRGDFVSNPTTNKTHGTCSLDYYHAAIKQILKKVDEPVFFIFSDDHEWVKTNIKGDCALTFVTNNDASYSYEDMKLMSYCKHHIIANSSFSWWGAWLGKKQGQIVIAPEPWFELTIHQNSIYVADWIRISKSGS